MFKSFLTICLWATLLLWGGTQGWSEDMEDHFINPDLDTSKTIFIDVKDVSLVNVLKIISQQTGLSFIETQDVADKKITLYLNKVPLNEALQTLLDANGLDYEMQEDTNVFVVKQKQKTAKNLVTKVYQLKYATVSSSPLNSTISTASPGTSGGAASKGGLNTGGLEDVLKNTLSPDGKVVEDVRTNSLIVTDNPGQFTSIDRVISNLDVPVPQVLIEVEMIDVSKSKSDQLGVSYGTTPLTFTGGSKFSNWPFGANVGGPTSSSSSSGSSSSSNTSSSASSGSNSGATTGWNAAGSGATLSAALNFLITNTDGHILARPRILTLNNDTALIQISTDQVASFQANVTSSTTSSIITYTPQRYTTGVILKVTPQANLLTREVTMAVSPKDIDLIQSSVQPPNPSVNGLYNDPQTRGTDSILKLKDGQTMMIGGLVNNQTTNTVTKLPVLGDLPFIGAAFRSKNSSKSERELIIFLTPHIIDDTSRSSLKDSTAISAQAALDIQDADNRVEAINNSLNDLDSK